MTVQNVCCVTVQNVCCVTVQNVDCVTVYTTILIWQSLYQVKTKYFCDETVWLSKLHAVWLYKAKFSVTKRSDLKNSRQNTSETEQCNCPKCRLCDCLKKNLDLAVQRFQPVFVRNQVQIVIKVSNMHHMVDNNQNHFFHFFF